MDKKFFRGLLGIITITLLMIFALWNFSVIGGILSKLFSVLRPVIIGLAIAIILNNPMVKLNEIFSKKVFKKAKKSHEKLCKILSLVSVYIILLAFVAVIVFVIVPELVSSIAELSTNFDTYFSNFTAKLSEILEKIDAQTPENFKLMDEVYKFFTNFLTNIDTLLLGLLGITQGVLGVTIDILIGVVISIYLLMGKTKLYSQFKKICYAFFKGETPDKIVNFITLVNRTFANFISGQLTEAVILSVLCYLGMSIFRFDFALLISFIIGISSLIPIVGAFIGTVPSAFLLLLISPIKAVWFVIFIIVLQQIEGNIIYPHVVGHKVGLSSFWVLLAIIIGGGLGGILGMLLGVPCMSIIYEITSGSVNKKLKEKNIKSV